LINFSRIEGLGGVMAWTREDGARVSFQKESGNRYYDAYVECGNHEGC